MSTELITPQQQAAALCSDLAYYFQTATLPTTNISQNLSVELPKILCKFGEVSRLSAAAGYYTGVAMMIIILPGMLNCLMALIVFHHQQFKETGFVYYRSINLTDLIFLCTQMEMAFYFMFTHIARQNTHWVSFHSIFGYGLFSIPADFSEAIVAWISFERAICYFPTVFSKINRKPVAYCTMATLLPLIIGLLIPQAFLMEPIYKPDTGMYFTRKSAFGQTEGFHVYQLVYKIVTILRTIATVIGSFATVVVLWMISRKQDRLVSSLGQTSAASTNLQQHVKTNKLFCIMQLCEAFPVIIRAFVILVFGTPVTYLDINEYVSRSYAEALTLAEIQKGRLPMSCIRKLVEVVSHSSHFFLYFVFVKRIRFRALSLFTQMSCFGFLSRVSDS